ncbi:hypothetical protein [Bacillus pseudomycoides]|uniref:hypothetical protein n=1 Tax=Bacillus pseudomycoides TaxID=64104 RepID=UPI000BF23E9E|nr:hypothetical protein [Bacillus pseudomycoides]PEI52714.1 hypothetical protein CN641_00150 [Bacillus pseudomycoides]PGA73462.1 hypothetical protein COL87_06610 [Bacillus pseudomycoides]PHE12616.1 hypothetical protein COF59_15570 [Bacillus pseudomycoides]PHE96229.1 hypothetical protein COF78_11265 [Bacillus pseudomycoides]
MKNNEKITFRFAKKDGEEINLGDLTDKRKIVIVINNQITFAPNTTQIASGAGQNSAAGNNAAIDSSNTEQQQSVGAGGKAINKGISGDQIEPHEKKKETSDEEVEFVLIINNQINETNEEQASATQVASGGGDDSAAGTNAAIESSNTKQQHAVGGGTDSLAKNEGEEGDQIEKCKKRREKCKKRD